MVGDEPRDLCAITWNAVVPTVSSLKLHEAGEVNFFSYRNESSVKTVFLNDAGSGLSLWQVRTFDESGEITKTYPLDLEAHGRDVRKIRALRQLEDLEWIENLREVVEGADPDSVRESRQFDRLPLLRWSDPCKRVVLLGDAAHGMFPGPAQGARMAFEDAHQLSMLLHEALTSSAPEGVISEAVTSFFPGMRRCEYHAPTGSRLLQRKRRACLSSFLSGCGTCLPKSSGRGTKSFSNGHCSTQRPFLETQILPTGNLETLSLRCVIISFQCC